MTVRWIAASVAAVVARPRLWATAWSQLMTLRRPRWWTRPPFLPVPDPDYLRFRMMTVYGGDGSTGAPPDDLVAFLEWCRAWPTVAADAPGAMPRSGRPGRRQGLVPGE